ILFFLSSRRRHTRFSRDWSSDVCSSDLIVGRPNVGKSTLFNRLVGKRLALVDDTPGVTRDWQAGEGRLGDLRFTVLDTAGLEERSEERRVGKGEEIRLAA